MPNANIVLILDCSGSMGYYKYFGPAQTDQATFVQIMRSGDGLGLVGFSDNSWIFFPSNGASQLVNITGLPVQNQAVGTIMAQTTHNMTNISAAIATAHGMLASAATPRAIVLLSDGEANVGPDPLANLPTDIPIHTIALGPSAGTNMLQQIAYRTVGQGQGYHYAPSGWDLASIYNMIVQTTGVSNTALNAQVPLPNFNFNAQPLQIAGGQSEARVAVNWTDANTVYTPGTPVGAQISVALRDPNGNVVQPATTATGTGFVVLSVPNPAAGQWQVGLWSAQGGGAGATLQSVAGGFEPGSSTRLELAFEGDSFEPGKPVRFRAAVTHEGEPVKELQVTAVAESPLVSVEQALDYHQQRLRHMPEVEAGGGAGDRRKLALLEDRFPGHILPRERYPVETERDGDGHCGALDRTVAAGSHTMRVSVVGRSPADGSLFRREGRLSVHVG